MSNTFNRLGQECAVFEPDRDTKSKMSDCHAHEIMESFGWTEPVEHDERIVENRYLHTDFFYEFEGATRSVQKKSIVDLNFYTVTIPCHCYNDQTPFADYLFHGYYAPHNPSKLIRSVLVDMSVLRTIEPSGKRVNAKTGTWFYYWNYSRIVRAIIDKDSVEVLGW